MMRIFSSPKVRASTSLTPSGAQSRLVWALMALMPLAASSRAVRPTPVSSVRFRAGRKNRGWWVTINSAPQSAASWATSSKGSRATRIFVTGSRPAAQQQPHIVPIHFHGFRGQGFYKIQNFANGGHCNASLNSESSAITASSSASRSPRWASPAADLESPSKSRVQKGRSRGEPLSRRAGDR